jgi:prepilin peptidase CpaA
MASSLNDEMILPVMAALAAALIATVTDVKTLRIRNSLTVPLCVSGVAFHGWADGWSGCVLSLAGVAIGLVILIVPYLMGILGAGDVKLLMGMGAWLGAQQTAMVAFFGCLIMGLVSMVIMAKQDGVHMMWLNLQVSILRLQTIRRHLFSSSHELQDIKTMAADPEQRQRLIPFSVMLAMGAVLLVAVLLIG